MAGFFKWWEDATKKEHIPSDENLKKRVFKALHLKGRLRCEECGDIELKGIRQYTQLVHRKHLLPPKTIYIPQAPNYASYLELFGWKPLDPITWLTFLRELDHVDPKEAFGRRVLTALAGPRDKPTASLDRWNQVADVLASFACISTNHGFKKPSDSYLRVAGIWDDIPVADDQLLNDDAYERLGVRSRLEWGELLNRLEASTNTNDRFLRYLADMVAKEHLSDQQVGDLRRRKVFDSETGGKYAATALHQPGQLGDRLRELGLAIFKLRVVDSASTDLLNKLGVRVYPPLEEIDKWLAATENTTTDFARQCLTENGEGYGKEARESDVALIPTKDGTLAHSNEVFSSSSWEEFGFHIISSSLIDYAAELGVEKNPPPDSLIEHLKNDAPSMKMALRWFKQLSQCVNHFNLEQLKRLEEVPFIPFETYSTTPHVLSMSHKCLKDCFIMSSLPEHKPHLGRILPFVEFGEDGNNFLTTRSAKTEPPKAVDIARAMVDCPQGFLHCAGFDCYETDLGDIAKEFDSFCKEFQEVMCTSSMLLGRRHMRDGSYEKKLRQGCEILIGGDKENFSDFCRSVFVAPDGLKTLYEKLGSKPLDSCVTYNVDPTESKTMVPSPLSTEDIQQCINTFRGEEPAQDWQFDVSSCRLLVKTCRKLVLVKTLEHSLAVVSEGVPTSDRREVAAGFKEEPDGSITLWIVNGHKNMYTDVATALCRKLLKTYSRRDVLAMKLLLMDKESREVQSVPDKTETAIQTTVDGAPHAMSEGQGCATDPLSVIPVLPAASPIQKSAWKRFLKRRTGGTVVPKPDAVGLAKRAISSTPEEVNAPDNPRKSFRELSSGFKRKDIHCGKMNTRLEEDKRFKKHDSDIMFFMAKNSRDPEQLEEAVKAFAKLVVKLADVFKMKAVTFRIFWKGTDPNLMGFNSRRDGIYLNLAHYYNHHYHPKQVDKGRIILDWYFIFAHEIAHNVSFEHDEDHERTFAALCVSHLDGLREHFSDEPRLCSML